ncbi:hypothetical protein [Tsukamurella soli]|uniref:Excreted virulence factor EspC, type VII ESX diderm n=1 Tax=Tsukamurella soli TaxID=644556 RepID=A0ABP8J0J1_9ACTN
MSGFHVDGPAMAEHARVVAALQRDVAGVETATAHRLGGLDLGALFVAVTRLVNDEFEEVADAVRRRASDLAAHSDDLQRTLAAVRGADDGGAADVHTAAGDVRRGAGGDAEGRAW